MNEKDMLRTGEELICYARRFGATDAIVSVKTGVEKSVSVRDGKLDDVKLSEDASFSITAIVGERRGTVESSSFAKDDLEASAKNAVALAKNVTRNPHLRLARPDEWPCGVDELPKRQAALDRFDPSVPPTLRELETMARDLDATACRFPGIGRSEGSGYGYSTGASVRILSNGFVAATRVTQYSKYTSVIAERDGEMESASDWHAAFHAEDLRGDEECAQRAGEYAVTHLGARPIPTGAMPVLFDNRVSPQMLSMLFGAISGEQVYKRSTFLLDKLGERIFRPEVTILEYPHTPRKLGSRLYDHECVKTSPWILVNRGELAMWATSIESAAKLGLRTSTGHATGPANITLLPTTRKRSDLIASMKRGIIITELGRGVNLSTGAFSTGAQGFLVENGEIVRPVNKITVAGNLLAMWRNMLVADDLSDHAYANAPSCLIDEMMVGGE